MEKPKKKITSMKMARDVLRTTADQDSNLFLEANLFVFQNTRNEREYDIVREWILSSPKTKNFVHIRLDFEQETN